MADTVDAEAGRRVFDYDQRLGLTLHGLYGE
jgi:hypothetical protein